MEDRDSKKPFIIPKTHVSNKDFLIPEKPDSRNVTELFNDIKSCAFDAHFDFRQNECQSCDTIRNPKLQKLYNDRRNQMKKEQDPTERFAFHLITSRDMASNIATDGLTCNQLSFPIEKYLGNPKDGIHLSRRPDVLLASSGVQGLTKFGLLVCKILLGKGYPTLPSTNNKQLAAQLHKDYHFCKIQLVHKEQKRQTDDLLANSLIFCYEHVDYQTLSCPSQILPLAVLWYDLKRTFSSELTSTPRESQQRQTKKSTKSETSHKKKPLTNSISTLNTGTWEKIIEDTPLTSTTPTKYPSQFMYPITSLYTSFSSSPEPITHHRDPRVIRTISASENIPISPQKPTLDPSQPEVSLTLQYIMNGKQVSLLDMPLNSTTELIDPRLQTRKQTREIFYLEAKAVKRARQQQKRLNHYYQSKNLATSKTNYTLIPFSIDSVSPAEYERRNQITPSSSSMEYSSVSISLVDCFHFGFEKATDQLFIDLETTVNQSAYEQMEMSDRLNERRRTLNSKEIRLHLRDRHLKKMQEQMNKQRMIQSVNSRVYIDNGKKLLKERQVETTTNTHLSVELLDFFSSEYRKELRPHVKNILAELMGVFVEKYGFHPQQAMSNDTLGKKTEDPTDQTVSSAMDMELVSLASQGLRDHDERFPLKASPLIQTPFHQSLNKPSESIPPTKSELSPVESKLSTDSSLNCRTVTINQTTYPTNEDDQLDSDSNQSRNVVVKLSTKEGLRSTTPIPVKTRKRSRWSNVNDEPTPAQNNPTARTVMLVSNKDEDSLIIETRASNTDQQVEVEVEEENVDDGNTQPTLKRRKVDLLPSSDKESSFLIKNTDDHDYRQDLDDRKRQAQTDNNDSVRSRSSSMSTSSHHSSVEQSKSRSTPPPILSSTVQNRYPQPCRNQYPYHQQHSQSNLTNTTSRYPQAGRHQRFNYNHQPIASHPRFANAKSIPSPEKTPNYYPLNSSNYSQSISSTNVNSTPSYYQNTPLDYQYNYNNNHSQPPPLMSTTPLMSYSNFSDTKPSNTIERLQTFLHNRTNTQYDSQQSSTSNLPSLLSLPSSYPAAQSSWSLSNATRPNNPVFTYNDAEQLLSFVQNLRN